MAISNTVYQNKDVPDIFSDKDNLIFILLNPNIFPVDIFPSLKKKKKNDIQEKYLDATY